MASVFRSFLGRGHRFPCRCSDLRAQGAFISPCTDLRGHLRGHCKRPDRHRKRLTAPKPMPSRCFSPAQLARGSGRRGAQHHPASKASASVIQQAQQQGFLGHKHP